MVAQALVFAIGAVTRIDQVAAHLTARWRRRGFLSLAIYAEARGAGSFIPSGRRVLQKPVSRAILEPFIRRAG